MVTRRGNWILRLQEFNSGPTYRKQREAELAAGNRLSLEAGAALVRRGRFQTRCSY